MDFESVRKGMVNARFNKENSNILYGELLFISVFLGFLTHSWWVFGGALLGSTIVLLIPRLALVMCVIFSLGWGIIGYMVGADLIDSTGATVVLTIIGLVGGIGTHINAIEWTQDTDKK